jgi:mannose-6-phosphate isomerase-like protein (cupin superfamily)
MWIFGELVTYKVTAEQTGGAYSLFEVMSRPEEGGPPPHVQHREEEAFYVLEGEYEFLVEGRILRAGTGSLLYVPRGNLHAHRNVGEGVGRMLVNQTPGGLHERFFEEVGEPATDGSRPIPRRRRPWRGSWRSRPSTASRYRLPVDRQTDRDATERRVRCRGQERNRSWGTKNNGATNGRTPGCRPSRASTPTQWPSWWSTSPCSP